MRGHRRTRPTAAQAFLDFQKSADGQKLYAETGYRPLVDVGDVEVKGANDPSDPFPEPGDAADHRRRLRRLGRRQHQVLRRGRRHPHQDPGGGGRVAHECSARRTSGGRRTAGRRASVGRLGRVGARSLTPGSALGLGVAMIWFSLLVLIPLSAVVVEAADGGWSTFVDALTNEQTLAALELTVVIVARWSPRINMVMGTIIAWVLVRDRFPGKAHPRPGHRHPVRDADDRRRPGAALALRAGRARSASSVSNTRLAGASSRSRS